jgi:flagellar hook protein FlgE
MIGSLYSGISGLQANTSAMSVIGDNIANVDTTGFKVSRVSFSNVFNSSLGQSRMQIGRGVTMTGTNANWNSGTLETTTNVTDLAINGQGMFIVRDPADGGQYYTRAGQFEFDRDSYLVTQDGMRVQGYSIDTAGNMGPMGEIMLPAGMSVPQATTDITMGVNLDAGAAVADTFDTTMTVYDSLGNPVELTFNFERTATGWDYYVSSSTGTVTVPIDAPPPDYSLAFDAGGALDPAACVPASPTNPTIGVTGLAPANDLSITWTVLDAAGATDGSITGYAATSVKTAQTQNGYPSGMLQGISVDEDGIFTGLYSNGTMLSFAQVALADFASYSGLAKQGSNLYTSSLASGQPVISAPNTAGVGAIAPSSLEMSNVDLAKEFVELITTQRAFQANSKVITTSDEVLSELINIKR